MPNHYVGDLRHTIGISGRSCVRTELMQLAVVPALTPHPVQMHRQLPSHRDLCNLSSAPHGEVEELTAMSQAPLAQFTSVCVHKSNLLEARTIVQPIISMFGSPETTLRELR